MRKMFYRIGLKKKGVLKTMKSEEFACLLEL